MRRPIEVMGEGLEHPEGPDGRVVFVETYTSDVKVWEEGKGISVYGYCGGGTNACVVGSDGDVYVTQNGGTDGARRAPDHDDTRHALDKTGASDFSGERLWRGPPSRVCRRRGARGFGGRVQ